MTLHKKLFYSSLTLTAAGIIGMVPYANMYYARQQALANPAPVVAARPLLQTPTLVTGKPVQLTIPSLGLNLAVEDGTYNQSNGEWSLSTDKAHFAVPTQQPNNEAGNTLIYGHYRPEVFASLKGLVPGAQAVVTTDTGYNFAYTFTANEVVSPTSTEIFAYQGAPRLTLQTCTGAWMQNRQFFYFSYSGYEKV